MLGDTLKSLQETSVSMVVTVKLKKYRVKRSKTNACFDYFRGSLSRLLHKQPTPPYIFLTALIHVYKSFL